MGGRSRYRLYYSVMVAKMAELGACPSIPKDGGNRANGIGT